MGTKEDLRKILKDSLAEIKQQEFEEGSLKISTHLHKLLNDLGVIQKKLVIGVFAPIQKEPLWDLDLNEEFQELTAYPAYAKDCMVYRKALKGQLKMDRGFGFEILGPEGFLPEVAPEIIIVPGLGFDSAGRRLGRGKGFYDRYLSDHPAIKIGLAFEVQMTKEIPTEPHDVRMDFVVTDQRIYKINK